MAPLALMIGPHGSSPPSPYRARTGADTCTGFRAYPMVHITSSAPSMLIALRRKSSLPSPSRPLGRDRPVVVLAAAGHQHEDNARDLVGDRHRGHVWTAPLVKGFVEALRTSRARSCLRPVDAEWMAPLALMIGPHGSSPPSPYRAPNRRGHLHGLPSLSNGSHHFVSALDADRPSAKILLAEPFAAVRPRSAGRRIGRRGSSARRQCARPCWRPPPRSCLDGAPCQGFR